ncbi:MAG: hypothetical protein WB609_00155 [Candidatus Cybelea sp.]
MSDSKTQAAEAIRAHAAAIDQLHAKLAALPGCDTARLTIVVRKYKSAHEEFEDDALECVVH